MDYLRGYKAVFDDPEWVSKVAVAFVLFLSTMCIPILGQIVVLGWTVESMRRDLRGEPGLAELTFSFDAWKPYIDLGFKHFLVQILYAMPIVFLIVPVFVVVPLVLGFAAGPDANDAGPLVLGALACGLPLFFVLMVVASMFSTYAMIRVDVTGDLSKAFAISEVGAGVSRLWKEMLVGSVALLLVAAALQLLGFCAVVFGVFVSQVITNAAFAIFRADLARLDEERGGPSLPRPVVDRALEAFR